MLCQRCLPPRIQKNVCNSDSKSGSRNSEKDEDVPENPKTQWGYKDSSWECSQTHKNPDGDTNKLMKEERLEKLFSKLDLSGVQSWSNQDRNDMTFLIEEYHHLFALDDLEPGKTDMVKHSIKLNDYTPFHKRYCRIPPHLYDKVRKHLQEMLDIGAI